MPGSRTWNGSSGWDVVFADLYLDALVADRGDSGARSAVPRPWRVALRAEPGLPPVAHVLLGVNAHVNYDLPQALLGVISDEDFDRPATMARRRRDHERIDGVLASRVAAEDSTLAAVGSAAGSARTALDRLLQPLNRLGTKRFLREARAKVWHNTLELQQARVAGPDAYRARLAELELLSAARVADLLAPGQVILRLALGGFGVVLRRRDDGWHPGRQLAASRRPASRRRATGQPRCPSRWLISRAPSIRVPANSCMRASVNR